MKTNLCSSRFQTFKHVLNVVLCFLGNLPVSELLENLTFSDDNSDSDKDHRQQEGDNVDCNLTFEASCSSSEPHLLTQGDLNDLVYVWNLSKKLAELVGSRLNGWNLLMMSALL